MSDSDIDIECNGKHSFSRGYCVYCKEELLCDLCYSHILNDKDYLECDCDKNICLKCHQYREHEAYCDICGEYMCDNCYNYCEKCKQKSCIKCYRKYDCKKE